MSTRKQLSGAQKRALQQQAALKAKKMKGSMEQYLMKNQDATSVDIDKNVGKSEEENDISVTKDYTSEFQNNGTDFDLRHESNVFIKCDLMPNMIDDEENDRSLKIISNNKIKKSKNNEILVNMTNAEENSRSVEITSNEINLNISNEFMLKMTNDEENLLSLENISNDGGNINTTNEFVLNNTDDEELNIIDGTCSLENISKDDKKINTQEGEVDSFSPDPGLWPMVITEEMRDYFTSNKPCQFISEIHNSARLCYDKTRVLTEHNFYRMKQNKEKIKREWLIYSPVKKAVFCYVCKLFSCSRQSLCDEGFTNWKNVSERLSEHENSRTHRDSVLKLSSRAEKCKRIDCEILKEYNKECMYWRSVLTRVVSVIKFLAERGLPIFGDDETIGSLKNGNFLGCLELLAKFDPFICEHLEKHGNPGTGNVNYLSSTVATELLQLMSDKVLKYILSELSESKYYGLILDSTPDISHTDQLSVVLRYVNTNGEPVERFIKFLPISSHDAESLSTTVLSELESLNLNILNCRGQSYDNASNMAGRYSGLQARIKDVSPLAEYVPCAAHSLNLVGVNAVQCCNQAISFFGIVQNIYIFFSSSTQRWNTLQEKLKKNNQKLTLKPLSSTRWSAEADATKVLRKAYMIIRQTLFDISENENIASPARHEARSLCSKMNTLETALLTVIWDSILERINRTNKSFQNDSYDISSVVPMYKSLIKFIQFVRENFIQYEKEAKELIDADVTYIKARKKTISKRLDKLPQNETILSGKEAFIAESHYVICDALIMHLNKRMEAYSNLNKRFGFLYSSTKASEEEIKSCAKQFQNIYSEDIDEHFPDELIQFRAFAKAHSSPEESLKRIRSLNIADTFPNVDSAFHILLTLPISNCSSERSFSVLKRVKNHLRNTVSQDNLQAFSLLTIENNVTSKLNFDDVIDEFASRKARKKHF